MTASVLGAGSWGSALALLLGRNGHDVTLFGRNAHELTIMEVERENFQYLPGFPFPENVKFRHFLDGVKDCDLAVIAVPSNAVEEIAEWLGPHATHVAIASKGLEADTGRLLTDVVADDCPNRIGVLSGPNLAVEIAKGIPTVAVAASASPECAEAIRTGFHSATFRVSPSSDVVGVELAGALKNVLAIGGGMSDGLGYGDNTKGAFLSRGLVEMAKLGVARGGLMETFLGPAGVGDLFATASSKLSRNYRLGYAVGSGESLRDALKKIGQVVEGVATAQSAIRLGDQLGVELPVISSVNDVLLGHFTAREAVTRLMSRRSESGTY
jgi:glycerol-3-phosphate dehydrogenase (NAD(P)+)